MVVMGLFVANPGEGVMRIIFGLLLLGAALAGWIGHQYESGKPHRDLILREKQLSLRDRELELERRERELSARDHY